jgi:hypothetical protein
MSITSCSWLSVRAALTSGVARQAEAHTAATSVDFLTRL